MNADSGVLIESSDRAVRQRLEAAGVRFLMASYMDMHAVSKAKLVPIDHFDQMMAGSEMFTGAALEGVPQSVHDNEMAAHPDAASAVVLPWDNKVAWLASDLWLDDAPFQSCSRSILKRQTAAAAQLGYRLNLGIEAEFYVLRQREDGSIVPLSDRRMAKPCYDGTSARQSVLARPDGGGHERSGLGCLFLRPGRRARPVRDRLHLCRCRRDVGPLRVPAHDGRAIRATERLLRQRHAQALCRSHRQRRAFQHVTGQSWRQPMGSAMAKAWHDTKQHDTKQAECLEYMAHVSQWELDRYLKFF